MRARLIVDSGLGAGGVVPAIAPGFGSAVSLAARNCIPHFGHLDGRADLTSACIGQTKTAAFCCACAGVTGAANGDRQMKRDKIMRKHFRFPSRVLLFLSFATTTLFILFILLSYRLAAPGSVKDRH